MTFEEFNALSPAFLHELKPGDKIVADAGFTCINPWSVNEVLKDEDGLYVLCSCGRHYLDGQVDRDEDPLVGLRLASA